MIYQIIDLPPNMVGFKAAWDVTVRDFEEVVLPCVKKHVEKNGQINYLLVLKPSVRNMSFTWLQDVLLTLRHICKWKRAAIVSDSATIKYLTGLFNFFVPTEFLVFNYGQMNDAINWVSENQSQLHSHNKL